jgi:cardiolipin synthase
MRKWEKEEVFFKGDHFFSRLIEDISKAKKSIFIESYIFCEDELGRLVVEALNEACQRGVDVKFMVDGVGSSLSAQEFLQSTLSEKIKFKIYHPVPWSLSLDSLQNTTGVRAFLRLFLSLNRRNHRKICSVDNHIAYVGSMNLCAAHVATYSRQKAWRDTGVRVEGPAVKELAFAFYNTWRKADSRALKAPTFKFYKHKSKLIRLNGTWSSRHRVFLDLLMRIDQAREKIWITSAYFVPHGRLVKALTEAGKRGVDVRILGPRNCDIFFIPLVRSAFYELLIKSGVHVFEYLPTMLHAKTMIIDKWATVGSSNLNHRSLRHDLEVDMVISHASSLGTLNAQFLNDLKSSAEVTSEELSQRPWLQTGSGQALLLLKNWM